MKITIAIIIVLIVSLGVVSGVKGEGRLCNDPELVYTSHC